MKYYVTDKFNVADQLLDLLDTEVLAAMDSKIYMVEEVDPSIYLDKKFKVYTENDVFKGWMRILESNRITIKYANLIYHPDSSLYAIPIMEGLRYYDVEQKVIDLALTFGTIDASLSPDWFSVEP